MAKSKKMLILIPVIALGIVGVILLLIHMSPADSQNNETSVTSMIHEYTKDKSDLQLTIGVLKAGKKNFKVFAVDAKELVPVEYEYEIGSISKTITTSILCKAVADGLIDLDSPVSNYIPLDMDTFYPTVLSLAIHTSGYGEYPFSTNELSQEELEKIDYEFYENKTNIYQGINRLDILEMLKTHVIQDKSYDWEYSNFGIAVLGTILGDVYDTSYKELAEDFINHDLGLNQTRLGNGTGNLTDYWTWNDDDTYLAAGGFVSTVTDLLKFGQMHLKESPDYLAYSLKPYQTFKEDGFSMGLGWIIDPETNYIWHNGGTSSYQSFLGIDKEHKTVVVVLSNYPTIEGDKEDVLDLLGYSLLDSLSDSDTNAINVLE